jgi:hypothetical protein
VEAKTPFDLLKLLSKMPISYLRKLIPKSEGKTLENQDYSTAKKKEDVKSLYYSPNYFTTTP